jgi:hypothetical protein
LILLDNAKFISAQKLLEDKFILEFAYHERKQKRQKIELTIGDIACFVKPHSDFVCDTIVKCILSKRHNGLESPKLYVLITDNKFDFYNITQIAVKKYKILNMEVTAIISNNIHLKTLHIKVNYITNIVN